MDTLVKAMVPATAGLGSGAAVEAGVVGVMSLECGIELAADGELDAVAPEPPHAASTRHARAKIE
jgi:mevalonate kinase